MSQSARRAVGKWMISSGVHTPEKECLPARGVYARTPHVCDPAALQTSLSFFSSLSSSSSSQWMDAFMSYADKQQQEEEEERKTGWGRTASPPSSSLPSSSSSATRKSPGQSWSSSDHLSSSSSSRLRQTWQLGRRVSKLPLDKMLRESLKTLYAVTHLTPVQDRSFLPILLGEDLLVASPPGSGKTLAYLLPLLQRMLNERSSCLLSSSSLDGVYGEAPYTRGSSILILLPSRELCLQVASIVLSLVPSISIVVADSNHVSTPSLFSSSSSTASSLDSERTQKEGQSNQRVSLPPGHLRGDRRLSVKDADLIVGTPSRCLALLRQNKLLFKNLRTVVLDEGDALLRRGYVLQLEELLGERGKEEGEEQDGEKKEKKKKRIQTLIFTAVMSKDFQSLIKSRFEGKINTVNLLAKKNLPQPIPATGKIERTESRGRWRAEEETRRKES